MELRQGRLIQLAMMMAATALTPLFFDWGAVGDFDLRGVRLLPDRDRKKNDWNNRRCRDIRADYLGPVFWQQHREFFASNRGRWNIRGKRDAWIRASRFPPAFLYGRAGKWS